LEHEVDVATSDLQKTNIALTKERDRSDELLLNILPEETANELKEKGYSDAREFEKATILFADIKDFTAISQTMTAADLVHEIDACFKAFDEITTIQN
jgi:class 3 adenylate cyclase